MSSFAADRVTSVKSTWWTPLRVALAIWLVTAAVMLFSKWAAIQTLSVADPDDALRLVQVRDLLGGQGWWDVSQHRINPLGGGGLMHWSRLIDLPIAIGIGGLTPLIGADMAERITMTLWPLILLGGLFALLARCASRLGERAIALLTPALAATNYVILYQFAPLRIDHHGVQILLSLGLLYLTLRPASALRGAVAGGFAAMHLAISIEGLPTVALFGAIMAVDWAWNDRAGTRARLTAYLAAVAMGAVVLQFVTRGPGALIQTWCDALSAPYMAALGLAAIVVGVGSLILPSQSAMARWWRFALLGIGGALAGAAVVLIAPTCARGPFGTLDPIVVTYWYSNVREGLPIWHQLDALAGFSLAPTLVGLIGSVLAWRRSDDATIRHAWAIMIATLAGTFLLSLLVLRTASTAQMMALPGCAWVGLHLWRWARAIESTVPRILASLLCMVALPPASGAAAAKLVTTVVPQDSDKGIDHAARAVNADEPLCVEPVHLTRLNQMAPTLLLTPLDIGPQLLQHTRHSVVATGHHRNNAIMARAIRSFIGPIDEAETLARSTGATMIVVCPTAQEYENFRKAGDGLAAQLADGRVPDWLEPVPLDAGGQLRAWRIKPAR